MGVGVEGWKRRDEKIGFRCVILNVTLFLLYPFIL